MRVGLSPYKGQTSGYRPARVTVCMLVCIPEQTGYYAHRLEVLKLCLSSLVKHTEPPYDLMVFDNGSCAEVVSYLRTLRDAGVIRFLLLSSVNLGMAGAYRIMFHAAPGELIAYSDDDVLFYPGWLPAQLEILETYPRVGVVSGLPVRAQFRYGNRYLPAYLEEFSSVRKAEGHFIPDEWERDFFVSTGEPVEHAVQSTTQSYQDIMLEYRGLKAYSTATHFQFVAPKDVILRALAPQWDPRLMDGDREMDERIDALGYARLATFGRYVRHIGNVITPELARDVSALGLANDPASWTPPPKVLVRFAHFGPIRAPARRLYNWLYLLFKYRRLD